MAIRLGAKPKTRYGLPTFPDRRIDQLEGSINQVSARCKSRTTARAAGCRHAVFDPHRIRSRRRALRRSATPTRASRPCLPKRTGRRCGGAPTDMPASPPLSCAQQLSTASATRSGARLAAAFDPLDPAAILRARPAKLARLGLSAPKIRALKAIAKAVEREELRSSALPALEAEDAHAALTAVHGIGPWTADIYLLSCLGHPDAWPAGDLALQEAARVAFALPVRPNAKEMQALAEPWRPWRAIAARILWSYYRAAAEAAKAAKTAADARRWRAPSARARRRRVSLHDQNAARLLTEIAEKHAAAGRRRTHVDRPAVAGRRTM